jgi:chemotaxis protein CheY-P-specific phosphatase CheC
VTSARAGTETGIPVAVVLQEAMNIAVGKAAREIEDIFRFSMQLHVPTVDDVGSGRHFADSTAFPSMSETICTIEQEFYGQIEGLAYLFCEPDALLQISSAFGHPAAEESHHDPLLEYAALEVGSILTGSCIGSLAELSGAVVSFSVPRFRRSAHIAGSVEPPRGGVEPPRGGVEPPRGGVEPPRGGVEPPRGGVEPPRGDDGCVVITSTMRLDLHPVDLYLVLVLPAKVGEYISTALCWYA